MEGGRVGVLLMGYGSPDSVEEVGEYLANIKAKYARPGSESRPTVEEVEDLRRRYAAIGGRSPFNDITNRQAAALEAALCGRGIEAKVYVGAKHWRPGIPEAVGRMGEDRVARIIAIPMAPYYSVMSTEGYRKELVAALEGASPKPSVSFMGDWHTNELFIKSWEESIGAELSRAKAGKEDAFILFTTHSLPKAIQKCNDPYPDQFLETGAAIARRVGASNWGTAYQSASGKEWLGPDVAERLAELGCGGYSAIIIAPIGFVADNLETAYDIDIECVARFRERGLPVYRAVAPNASATFIDALASIVVEGMEKRQTA